MKIFIASDHRGFALKEQLKNYLSQLSNDPAIQRSSEVVDVGALTLDPNDDYVDFGIKALDQTIWQSDDRAILICGSGHGMDMVANRHTNIRAILGFNESVVKQGREHENANVLILPSDWTSNDQAIKLSSIFLDTPFSNEERHIRRLEKLKKL